MAEKRGPKRRAWVIVADMPNEERPRPPLAVLPSRTSRDVVRVVIDAFVQHFNGMPSDMADYLKREPPYYAARPEGWGQQVAGGYRPYVEAFRVDDLRVVIDDETGAQRFEYTRKPPIRPDRLGASDA